MPKPVKRQFKPAPQKGLSLHRSQFLAGLCKISASDFHNRFSLAAQWFRGGGELGQEHLSTFIKNGLYIRTSGGRWGAGAGAGGELVARQASEQSRDKCDMRLLTIYQHVECGRSSQREADESRSQIREQAERKRQRQRERAKVREREGLCEKYAKDKLALPFLFFLLDFDFYPFSRFLPFCLVLVASLLLLFSRSRIPWSELSWYCDSPCTADRETERDASNRWDKGNTSDWACSPESGPPPAPLPEPRSLRSLHVASVWSGGSFTLFCFSVMCYHNPFSSCLCTSLAIAVRTTRRIRRPAYSTPSTQGSVNHGLRQVLGLGDTLLMPATGVGVVVEGLRYYRLIPSSIHRHIARSLLLKYIFIYLFSNYIFE